MPEKKPAKKAAAKKPAAKKTATKTNSNKKEIADYQPRDWVKFGTSLVMGLGVSKIVKGVVENNVETDTPYKKVVVFADRKSKAETTFKLPSGWYEGTLYVWAEGDDSASTHLLIEAEDYDAGVSELPVRPWDKKEIAPCFPMKFRIGDAKQLRKIVLRPDDLGVRLDRLEIKRMGR